MHHDMPLILLLPLIMFAVGSRSPRDNYCVGQNFDSQCSHPRLRCCSVQLCSYLSSLRVARVRVCLVYVHLVDQLVCCDVRLLDSVAHICPAHIRERFISVVYNMPFELHVLSC